MSPSLLFSSTPPLLFQDSSSLTSQAAAHPVPEIETTESTASTVSLIDVDIPSVHTVPSDFKEQAVTTETEAARIAREVEAEAAAAAAKAQKAAKAAKDGSAKLGASAATKAQEVAASGKAKAKEAARAASASAQQADQWLTSQFATLETDHPTAAKAAVAGNLVAVVGLGAFLGFRAWGLHEQGRLSWKAASAGLALLGAVGVVEGVFAK